MRIKNFMRAKAWLFTLLICMISLVGFGFTTSDLAQNSAVMETNNDIGEMTIVVNKVPVMEQVFIVVDNDQVTSDYDALNECRNSILKEAKAIPYINSIDDVGWQSSYFNIVSTYKTSNIQKATNNKRQIHYVNKLEVVTCNSLLFSKIKNRYQFHLFLC